MFKILIEADLILEALMNRTEFTADVSALLEMADPSIQMYLTNVGLQKTYAYATCLQNSQIADTVVNWLIEKIQICLVDQSILQAARLLPVQDFESAVEIACLDHCHLDAIVTYNPEKYTDVVDQFCIWSFRDLWLRLNLETQLQVSF